MAAAAHSPEFARKVGISQSAAKEWHAHDKAQGRFLKSLAEAMEKAKKPAKGPSKDPTLNWHEVPLDDDIQYSQGIIGRHSTDIRSVDDPYHYGRYEIDQTHPESRARNHPHKEYEVWHLGTGQSERGPMGGPYLLSGHDSLDEAKAAAHQHNLQRTLKRHVIRHYGLKPHEVKAVEAAWPGEGVKRFHGQHPDMVRHEVDRALGAIEKAKDPAQQEFARERSKEREEEQLRQREEREMEHMEHDEGIKKMFAGRGRYLADEQYHREQVKRNRRAATIKHHGFNDEQVNALEHAHGPEALERFHPDNDVHPDMVRNEVKRAVKHYREYAPHNEGAITAAGAEPDVSNIITHAPPVRANPNDPSTWWGRKRELQEAVKKPKLKKAVKDLRQDVIRAKRRAEPGSALNATLRYIGIEAKNRRSPRAEVVDKTPEMLAAERATIPGRPANVKTHFEQYPASWEPYLKAAYPDDEPIEKVSYKPKKPLNYYEQHEKDVASGVAATKFKQKAQDVLRDVKANVSTGQKRPSGERSMRGSGKSPMRAEPGNSLFAVGPKRSSKLAGAKERRAYAYGTHWNAVVHHPAEKVVVANNHQYGGSTKLMVDTLRREIPKEFPGHTVILVHHPHAQRSSEITGGTLDEVHAHLKEAAAKHPEPEHRERAAQDLVKLSRILKK